MRKTLFLVSALIGAMAFPAVQAKAQTPLSVKVLPPELIFGPSIRFETNQPAYIAAFIIYPGNGVRLVYPEASGPEQLWSAGYHDVRLLSSRYDNDFYSAALGPVVTTGPRYLYIVASAYPLDVARFVHRPMLLESTIGFASARSFLVDAEFDALVSNALPLGDDATWDADSYILWSSPRAYHRTWYAEYRPLGTSPCYLGFSTFVPDYYYQPLNCDRPAIIRSPWRIVSAPVRRDSSRHRDIARGFPHEPDNPMDRRHDGDSMSGDRGDHGAGDNVRDRGRDNPGNDSRNGAWHDARNSDLAKSRTYAGNGGEKIDSDARTVYSGKKAQEFFRNRMNPGSPNSSDNGHRDNSASHANGGFQNATPGVRPGMTPPPSSSSGNEPRRHPEPPRITPPPSENSRLAPNPAFSSEPRMHPEPPRMTPPPSSSGNEPHVHFEPPRMTPPPPAAAPQTQAQTQPARVH